MSVGRAERAIGGSGRLRVVLVLAATLGLDGADHGTVSAASVQLREAFGIGNTQIGLLVTVVAAVGAIATLPIGVVTDRVNRVRLLAGSVALWAVATVAAALAPSFIWLLVARIALGIVTATAGPTVISLSGDSFPIADRGRLWGYVLSGELVGTGIGFVISGELASLVSWRVAFAWLVIPAAILVWQLWRLPEPARGGSESAQEDPGEDESGPEEGIREAVAHRGVEPDPSLVLHDDPTRRSLWWAIRYVLRIRTNVLLVLASALGYFFFEGLRSFALVFTTAHYGISSSVAVPLVLLVGIGAIAGVVLGGRVTDGLLRRGRVTARVLVPSMCLLVLPALFAPAVITTAVAVALPLLVVGASLLGAVNPPLDAARLDIVPPSLWGRAEAVRTLLRRGGEAAAPTVFGVFSEQVFTGPDGLELTFLVFLAVLIVGGVFGLLARRTYPRDVATAAASAREVG